MKNVIILGSGRTGSSVLAGLISRNRYYVNKESIEARRNYPQGDYENPDLVQLNEEILQEAEYDYKSLLLMPKVRIDIGRIEKLAESGNSTRYREYVAKRDKEGPWLWKDPRLGFTIFFWKYLLDLNNVHFIFLTRDPYQIFRSLSRHGISYTKREVYQRYRYRLGLVEKFVTDNNLQVLRLDYSELWDRKILNNKLKPFMGIEISEEDYSCVVKTNIKREESRIAFLKMYYCGVLKLKIRRLVMGIPKCRHNLK